MSAAGPGGRAAGGGAAGGGAPGDGPEPVATFGVAVAVPQPYAAELEAWRERFGDPWAHTVPAHVTLLPPTALALDGLPRVEEHLASVAASLSPFPLRLRGTGTFRPVSPVVFVAVAEGIAGCEQAERAVRSGVLARDLYFPYHPHVTVAHDVAEGTLDDAFASLAGYDVRFDVDALHLYEHGADGVWRTRRDFAFGVAG